MLRSEEFFVQRQIKELGGLFEIDKAIELIEKYHRTYYTYEKQGETVPFESKNRRLAAWDPDKGEVYELVLAVFTATLINPPLTYQAIAGMTACRINLEDHIDQVKTAAEVIALISKTGLITISRTGSGNYIMVSTDYELDELPELERHAIQMKQIRFLNANKHEEYGSLILGGRENHHDDAICLDHLNRMNSIQFKLNKPFLCKYEEAPTFALDTREKKEQWEYFVKNSYRAYIKLVRAGNRFYLCHKYDKRGRCYAEGYHINTQGSAFKKTIIQLAQVELVEGV